MDDINETSGAKTAAASSSGALNFYVCFQLGPLLFEPLTVAPLQDRPHCRIGWYIEFQAEQRVSMEQRPQQKAGLQHHDTLPVSAHGSIAFFRGSRQFFVN